MINIERSTPPPQCLEKEKSKADGDYKCGDVLERLVNDFHGKCYLCENTEPHKIEIDHFLPHRGNKELKFDWNNLFLACGHCNNTKGDKFDNILNCTNPAHDVENRIKYEMKPFPGERVKITSLKDDERVNNTVRLLMEVFNGSTPLKVIESSNIRKTLLKELLDFQKQLLKYAKCDKGDKENKTDREREKYSRRIEKHLAGSSAFTAFKRWIIKENPIFREIFEQYFD
jgi:hypothetical protein